jgi:hypothetical protein
VISTEMMPRERNAEVAFRRGRQPQIEWLEGRHLFAASNLPGFSVALAPSESGGNGLANAAAVPAITEGRLAYHGYTDYGIDGELHVWDFALGAAYTRAEQTVNARVRYVMNPQFSGDGRYLVMMGVDRQLPKAWPNLDIFAYDFHTDSVMNLSEALVTGGFFTRSQDWIDEDPSFNPTTLTVAFKRRNSGTGQSDLWSMQLNAANLVPTSLTQLTNTPSVEESGPKFSPDGQTIVCWVNGGSSAWIGTLPASGGAITLLADNAGIQDYYPSYWDSTRVIYTSWDSAASQDDDIRIRELVGGTDVFAAGAFHSAGEDSDAFRISSSLVGFSSTTGSADGKWRLRYGNPLTGQTQVLPFHTTNKHDLGGTYTPLRVGYAAALPGDYNNSGAVDAADYVMWRNTLASVVTNYSVADGDGSGVIDQPDHIVWRVNFGSSLPPAAAALSSTTQPTRNTGDQAVWFHTNLQSLRRNSSDHKELVRTPSVLADMTMAWLKLPRAAPHAASAPRTVNSFIDKSRQNWAIETACVIDTVFDEWPSATLAVPRYSLG